MKCIHLDVICIIADELKGNSSTKSQIKEMLQNGL